MQLTGFLASVAALTGSFYAGWWPEPQRPDSEVSSDRTAEDVAELADVWSSLRCGASQEDAGWCCEADLPNELLSSRVNLLEAVLAASLGYTGCGPEARLREDGSEALSRPTGFLASLLVMWLEVDSDSPSALELVILVVVVMELLVLVKMVWSLVSCACRAACHRQVQIDVEDSSKEEQALKRKLQFQSQQLEGTHREMQNAKQRIQELEAMTTRLQQERDALEKAKQEQEKVHQKEMLMQRAASAQELQMVKEQTPPARPPPPPPREENADRVKILSSELHVAQRQLDEALAENETIRQDLKAAKKDRDQVKQVMTDELAAREDAMKKLAAESQRKLITSAEEKKKLRTEVERLSRSWFG